MMDSSRPTSSAELENICTLMTHYRAQWEYAQPSEKIIQSDDTQIPSYQEINLEGKSTSIDDMSSLISSSVKRIFDIEDVLALATLREDIFQRKDLEITLKSVDDFFEDLIKKIMATPQAHLAFAPHNFRKEIILKSGETDTVGSLLVKRASVHWLHALTVMLKAIRADECVILEFLRCDFAQEGDDDFKEKVVDYYYLFDKKPSSRYSLAERDTTLKDYQPLLLEICPQILHKDYLGLTKHIFSENSWLIALNAPYLSVKRAIYWIENGIYEIDKKTIKDSLVIVKNGSYRAHDLYTQFPELNEIFMATEIWIDRKPYILSRMMHRFDSIFDKNSAKPLLFDSSKAVPINSLADEKIKSIPDDKKPF